MEKINTEGNDSIIANKFMPTGKEPGRERTVIRERELPTCLSTAINTAGSIICIISDLHRKSGHVQANIYIFFVFTSLLAQAKEVYMLISKYRSWKQWTLTWNDTLLTFEDISNAFALTYRGYIKQDAAIVNMEHFCPARPYI